MRTVLMVVYYNYPVEKMNNIIGKVNGKINAAILQHSAPLYLFISIVFIHVLYWLSFPLSMLSTSVTLMEKSVCNASDYTTD